jgi:DNA-binding MarR family transcriptional regulator
MKKCSKCRIEKELSEYHKNKSLSDNHSSACKMCRKNDKKEYYARPEIKLREEKRREERKRAKDQKASRKVLKKKTQPSKVLELSNQAKALKHEAKQTTPEKQVSYKIILDENDNPKKEKKQSSNESLTKRQKEVLECIIRGVVNNGMPPTYREIGEDLGIKSTNGVSEHVNMLIRKGYIDRLQGGTSLARGIVLTKKCDKLIPMQEPVTLALRLHGTIESILNRSKTVTISKDGKMTFWIDNSENK